MFGNVRNPPGKAKRDSVRALFHVEVLDLLRLGQVGAALLLRHRWSDHVAHLSYRPVVGGWKSGRTPVELSRRWAVWMCGAYRNWSYETRRNCKPFGKLCCYLLEIAVLLRTISNYRIHMPPNTWFKPGVGPPFLGNLASVFQHVPCRPWVIWHASSRCVASKYMELENVKGSPWESCRKPKESKQKLTKC